MSTSIRSACFLLSLATPIATQSYSELPETAIPSYLLTPFTLPSTYAYGTTSLQSSIHHAGNVTSTTSSSTSKPLLGITGKTSSAANATASISVSTSTSSPARPTNTQTCNGYVEFCARRLSNISFVVAHNSPFVVAHNAASNQVLEVRTQLNDGIRGLQFETHKPNETLLLCHTDCDLLNAGSLQDYLTTVATWLEANPYEVISIIMGNDDRVPPTDYVQPFTDAGLLPYLYTPDNSTYTLDQWPTLAEMIIQNKRVVVMLDYLANQAEVPWLLDEFAYQWETPFSPTDPSFPCLEQRPPNQPDDTSRNKMYMANHNLNIAISIAGLELLIPAYTLLDQVNAVSGNGSLGRMVENCTAMWGRPPNWLLVDYYNYGNVNGSVFQVAATANNVASNNASCCGSVVTSEGFLRHYFAELVKFSPYVVVALMALA